MTARSSAAKGRAAIVAAALAVALLLAVAAPARAAVEVPFVPRFAASVRGDLALAANTLLTCPAVGATEAACLAARAGEGGSLNNNGYAMELVDVDGDPATFDSSVATLALPPAATVQFAGLFYGGRTSKGGGAGAAAAPEAAARGAVLLRAPGSLVYAPLAASVHDSSGAGIAAAYTGYVDVTPIVAAAGSGTYTVANVQAGTGEDRYAGWSLVVAYADPAAAPHSIRVFEGLAVMGIGDPPLQIGVEGLETPPAGSVAATVGVVAYEGDRGSSGDRLTFAGQPIFDLANPVNNVFNSSIANRGVDLGGRTPNYLNQLGFDADLLGADGILANDATAAVLEESTSFEQYLTQAVALSVQLDPAALEPPAPPASPVPPTPPAQPAPSPSPPKQKQPDKTHKGDGGKGGEAGAEPAPLRVEVEPTAESARPTAVVSYSLTVSAGAGERAPAASVCNQLPAGLERLAAPGAVLSGRTACWHLGRLAPHAERRLTTTARVEATVGTRLLATTTLRVAGERTRRVRSGLRVRPLPPVPCGRVALRSGPVAQASC